MVRKLRLPPRHYQAPNTLSEFPYPNIRSHSNVRRIRTRIQPQLLHASEEEEEAISGPVQPVQAGLDDEQPIMVSGDTNNSEYLEINSDEVCIILPLNFIITSS
jgi:hypothetical protein